MGRGFGIRRDVVLFLFLVGVRERGHVDQWREDRNVLGGYISGKGCRTRGRLEGDVDRPGGSVTSDEDATFRWGCFGLRDRGKERDWLGEICFILPLEVRITTECYQFGNHAREKYLPQANRCGFRGSMWTGWEVGPTCGCLITDG